MREYVLRALVYQLKSYLRMAKFYFSNFCFSILEYSQQQTIIIQTIMHITNIFFFYIYDLCWTLNPNKSQ